MTDLVYQIKVNSRNLTRFIQGNDWLIGLTAERKDELSARLIPYAESGSLDMHKIDQCIAEFIEWFIADYEKKERQQCPYDESEIVESAGIVFINGEGTYKLYCYGKFRFYHVSNDVPTRISDNHGQLTEDSMLIADPKEADVAVDLIAIERNADLDDAQKYHDYPYPFAIIKSVKKSAALKPTHKKYNQRAIIFSMIALAFGTGFLFLWLNKIRLQTQAVKFIENTTDYRNEPESKDDTNLISSAPETILNNEKLSAERYLEKAEQAFYFARSYMESGKNAKAIKQLDSAEYYYRIVLQSDSSLKGKLQPKLAEINIRKGVLHPDKEIE